MKLNNSLLLTLSCFACIFAMIVLPDGYKSVGKSWPELLNKPMEEVKQAILKEIANVQFVVHNVDNYKMYPSEFWFKKVRLVVNGSNVVVEEPPNFCGMEPDFSLVGGIVGQKYKTVLDTLHEKIPTLKVSVFKNGEKIHSTSADDVDYARLDVDSTEKVMKEATYVRVVVDA
ncbi:hypothetical protein HELRODRAFT_188488 [Helobdella robusta]|uniref:Uncharacterized protein n=1 Tax=Helobdella robusta TaxID=6412 RepID=T1FQ17_HELRO|nr:hypothetical protein HELRODRAFT_188488 [Helobdella robusta]ESO01818.1 hypothetical protein HELRODRAFT_188488 [Helobdella robusta]